MAKLFQRIGAKDVKFELEVEIHYLKIKLPHSTNLKIKVKRGKDKVQETQAMQYFPESGRLQFDYPLNFSITMYKKGNSYVKKDLSISVIENQGEELKIIGKVTIEFHKLAEKGISIEADELNLENSSDKNAKLCISVRLFEAGKPRSDFMTGNLNALGSDFNRRAVSFNSQIVPNFGFLQEEKNTSSLIESSDWQVLDKSSKIESDYIENESTMYKKNLTIVEESSEYLNINQSIKIESVHSDKIKDLKSDFFNDQDDVESIEIESDNKESDFVEIPQIEKLYEFENPDSNAKSHQNLEKHTPEDFKSEIKTDKESDDYKKIEKKFAKIEEVKSFKLPEFIEKEQKNFDLIKEAEKNEKKELVHEIIIPDYLKYVDQHELDAEISLSKDLDESSSSADSPIQINIEEPVPALPSTNLKESIANSSSKEAEITLKEIKAGIPTTREARCCSACNIY
jgi:N-terminal C2 in EEIG1 and EHBP1 proteins